MYLGIQLLVTDILSVLILGFGSGHWLAGIIAPLWGIAILPLVIFSLDRPLHIQMLAFAVVITACFTIVVIVATGRCRRVWGHISLLAYNLLSFLVLLGLK